MRLGQPNLVRNLAPPTDGSEPDERRARLIARDAGTIEEALSLLRTAGQGKMWQVLEGPTYPDAILETPDAVIVIEGKRTEAGPTTKTKWLAGRHQMWRHLDAAWEVRGPRQVFGFFLVEGLAPDVTEVPLPWREAAALTVSESVIESSLPHRGLRERQHIPGRCYVATRLRGVQSRTKRSSRDGVSPWHWLAV